MTAELSQWLAEQKARGCGAADLIDAMIRAGHPKAYARQVVQAAFHAGAEPARERTAEAVRRHVMNAPNAVLADGREVPVLFAMAAPRIVLFGGVLSDEECAELIAQSAPKLKRAEVVDPATGRYTIDEARVSEGTHFARGETALVARIEQRVAALTGIPVEHQEPLQILHYSVGGKYEPHFDFFKADAAGEAAQLKHGGQRIATLVMYLNDVAAGGATLFPRLGVETKPRRGHAVYFENVDDAGEPDARMLHAGAPVGRGEKWIATKWLREGPYTG